MITLFAGKLLASCTDVIGCITPPPGIDPNGIDPATGKLTGIMTLLNNFLKLIFIVAGLYVFINIIIAGFTYMNASGDPKKLTQAWDKIWQSLMGLLIIVCSFIIAAVMGMLLFGNPLAILMPTLGK